MTAASRLVSVIIPCFNGGRFLREAIDSALSQDYSDVEVVLVNDGSTDDTAAIAEEHGSRIKYVWQPNAGLSAARNRGILESTGEFLVFLDADDRIVPDHVSKLHGLLEQSPESGAAFCGWYLMSMDGERTAESDLAQPSGDIFDALLESDVLVVHSAMVRRACLAESGIFEPALRQLEDKDLWLRLASRFHFAFLPEHLAEYRQNPASMARNWAERSKASRLLVERLTWLLDAAGRPRSRARRFYRYLMGHQPSLCVQDGFRHYWRGEYVPARRKMAEAIVRRPQYLLNSGVVSVLVRSFLKPPRAPRSGDRD